MKKYTLWILWDIETENINPYNQQKDSYIFTFIYSKYKLKTIPANILLFKEYLLLDQYEQLHLNI
jgi:hypothetical protein